MYVSIYYRKKHKYWKDKRLKEFQLNFFNLTGITPGLPDPVNGGNNVSINFSKYTIIGEEQNVIGVTLNPVLAIFKF